MATRKPDSPPTDLPAGLSKPARRALAAAGCSSLEQLTGLREDQVQKWHGMGPKTLELLRHALAAQGLSFQMNLSLNRPV